MAVNNYEYVWHNGKIIPWGEATIHVSAHALHYASSLFEGIRCYETPHGAAIFRLNEHTDRLVNSAKIYRMELPYTREQLAQAMVRVGAREQRQTLLHSPLGVSRCGRNGCKSSEKSH